MNTIEIKNKLIDHIKASTDNDLLEGLYNYLVQDEGSRKVYQLSEKQNLAIAEARAQYKKGDFLTDEQSNKEIDEDSQ